MALALLSSHREHGSIEQAPDPRFGMQLPYVVEQTTTYPRKTLSVGSQRLDIPDVIVLYVALGPIPLLRRMSAFSRVQSMDNKTWVLDAGGRRLTKTLMTKAG